MSKGLKLNDAIAVANRLQSELAPVCRRIETTGAIRRRQMKVWTIKFLMIPSITHDPSPTLFPEDAPQVNRLLEKLDQMVENGTLGKRLDDKGQTCWGGVHQKASFEGIDVDFHSVMDPAQWGHLMAFHTGPTEFALKLLVRKTMGGLLPNAYYAQGGYIWEHGIQTPVELFEEEDFFRLLKLPYTDPQERGQNMAVRPDQRVSA